MASPIQEKWTNPKDVMKIHRIKRHSSVGVSPSNSTQIRLLRRNSLSDISSKNANTQLTSKDCSLSLSQKRKNPFSCDANSSSSKRKSVLCLDSESSISNSCSAVVESDTNKLLHGLDHLNQMLENGPQFNPDPATEQSKLKPIVETTQSISPERVIKQVAPSYEDIVRPETKIVEAHPDPPLDWSLKTKLRIVAHSAKDKFDKVPGIDARHVDSFIHSRLENSPEWAELDVYQKLKRCCMHYIYPQMPWISTFPRISSDYKSRLPSILSTSDDAIAALHKDWMNAFTSVYQQYRGGLCPYFYTCTHQFNVLFRCQRTADGASLSALLSPSTRGLREMLKKEGVEFRMPNIRAPKTNTPKDERNNDTENIVQDKLEEDPSTDNPSNQLNAECSALESQDKENDECEEKKEESDDDIDDDEGASRWLEGMGLDKKHFPTLEPVKVKIQREGFRDIDNRPQSMVYVEGADVHTFFNFLLNYPSATAQSGPQHGIPPTILSPVMFVGATLVQNTVKHSVIRSDKIIADSGSRNGICHVFEVSGPILPHHTLNIATILRGNEDVSKAVLSYSTHTPSAALNTQAVNQEEKDKLTIGLRKLFVDFSLANPGLLGKVKERLVCPPVLENSEAVKELYVSPEGYLWTC